MSALTLSHGDVKEKILQRMATVATDSSAFERMIEEAIVLHKAQRFEDAVNKNIELVACLEANAKVNAKDAPKEVHAMATHNLGSALHQIGNFTAAKAFYAVAVTELAGAEKDPLEFIWKLFGDVRQAQLDFMKEKVRMAEEGKIPNPKVFLNGSGQEEEWSPEDISKAQTEAQEILKKDAAQNPAPGAPAMPTLNMNLAKDIGTSYPITSTPRKELW